jgi:hypothetical protein
MPSLYRYFSEEKNALAFVQKGEVLLRALSFFRNYEDEEVRGDKFEGTLVHLPDNGLVVKNVNTEEEILLPHRLESTAKEDEIFVYCMSQILSAKLAERFKAEIVVEIINPAKFLNLVRSSLSLRKRFSVNQLIHEPVKYYEWNEPPIVDWALPERITMKKPKIFEWQREYRLAVPIGGAFNVQNVNLNLVPVNHFRTSVARNYPQQMLRLGSLSKICRVHTMK